MLPEQIRLVLQSAALDECAVCGDVVTFPVFDKKHDIGKLIEQRLRGEWLRQLLEELGC